MSSGLSGGVPEFFTSGRRSTVVRTNMNLQQQGSFSSPLSANLADPTARTSAWQGPDSMPMGKRSLAEFQQQHGLEFYLRNVKPRHASPISELDFPPASTESSSVSNPRMSNMNTRYGVPIIKQQMPQSLTLSNRGHVSTGVFSVPVLNVSAQEAEKKMLDNKLRELEKRLLGDDEEEASTVTTTEWPETMLNLITPARKPISPSPTSSSSLMSYQ